MNYKFILAGLFLISILISYSALNQTPAISTQEEGIGVFV